MKVTFHNSERNLHGTRNYEIQYLHSLVLALFTIGIASLLGCDDLLAAFACGTSLLTFHIHNRVSKCAVGSAVSWDGHFNEKTEEESFAAVLDLVFNIACFVYIGAWLPFSSFNSPELGISVWRLLVLFITFLFLRRIPCILALYRWVPDIHNWREALCK
jgi:sodium/hydrogen antiporter